MRDLNPQEIEYYRENGFLAVPDLLTADELEVWRQTVEEATEERTTSLPGRDLGREADPYYSKVFTQKVNLWQTNPKIRDLILDPRIGKLIADLEGIETVRIWHDQALIKEPYANPTGFHLDVPYWSFSSEHACSIWVALDDATVYNGCLCYIPGSHKARKFDNVGIGNEIDSLFAVYPEWKDVEPVFCPVPAGGAVFHNGLTAHGAGANMTPRRRRAMTSGYFPDGVTFNGNKNILSDTDFEALRIGDPLASDERNPIVYTRRQPARTS